MEFTTLIKNRYSCRKYGEKKVEPEKVAAILEAGNLAPTGGNRQPQRIIVVQSEAGLEKIKACTTCHFDAPLVFIACYDPAVEAKNTLGDGRGSGIIDLSIVLTHMMLEGYNQGLANVWVGLIKPDVLRQQFQIPAQFEIIGVMPMGYPMEGPGQNHEKRNPLTETVFFETYEG